MANSVFQVPYPSNEPILTYAPGSPEKEAVLATYAKMYAETIEVPMRIGNKDITTGDTGTMSPPHDHKHILGTYHRASKSDIGNSIQIALEAKKRGVKCPGNQEPLFF